jgi:hypothetical protein
MMRMLRLLRACGLAAVLTIMIAACANSSRSASAGHHARSSQSPTSGGSTPAATGGATAVTKFTPYSATGVLTMPVTGHATGSCWTGSIVVPVLGAYRCLVGNDIADPCFAPPKPTTPATVGCVSAPWSRARVVTLTQPLPKPATIGRTINPWAVQLSNGVRCLAATGTVQSVDGVSLNLLCPGGMAAGGLDMSGPTWHVKYGAATASSLTAVDVTAAWHG